MILENLFIILLLSAVMIGIAAFPVMKLTIARDTRSQSEMLDTNEPVLEVHSRQRRNGMGVESKRQKRKNNKKVPNAGHNFSGKPKSPELKQPKSESKYCSSNCEGKRKRHL